MIGHYDWAGGREAMLRFGPDTGPVVVAALPLLEEANRTRTFVVTLLRALADRGVASALPDVPGQGESVEPLTGVTAMAEAWAAAAASVSRPAFALAVRSGALLDHRAALAGRWHFSPVDGAQTLRDLHRTWLAGERRAEQSRSIEAMVSHDAISVAGTTLPRGFLASLAATETDDSGRTPRRVARLSGDPRPANRSVEGVPLWHRAEPGDDPVLAMTLADDIASWLTTCAA